MTSVGSYAPGWTLPYGENDRPWGGFACLVASVLLIQPYYLLLPVGLGLGIVLYPLITLTVVFLGAALSLWEASVVLPALWVTSAVLQNLFIGLYLHLAPEAFDRLLLPLFEIKSVILIGGISWLLLANLFSTERVWLRNVDARFAAFLAIVACNFAVSSAPTVSKFAYLRNFTAFILLHLLGRWSCRSERAARIFFTYLMWLGAVLTLVSLADLLWPEMWAMHLNVERIEAAKGPISHITDFLGITLRRLKSGVGEPVNAGYIFAGLAAAALSSRRYVLCAAFATQLLLTFAKGPMLIFGACVMVWTYVRYARWKGFVPRSRALVMVAGGIVVGAAGYVFVTALRVSVFQTTTWAHFVGLGFGLLNAVTHPLGRGIGTGGNYRDVAGLIGSADRPAAEDWLGSGAESAVGVVGTQLGILGLVVFVLAFAALLRESWRAVTSARDGSVREAAAIVATGGMFGLSFTSLLQEGALSPQAAGLFYLVSGVAVALRLLEGERTGTNVVESSNDDTKSD